MRTRRKPFVVAAVTGAILALGAAVGPGLAAQAAQADCTAAAWSSGATYTAGDQVTHAGSAWHAKWWTSGEEPGTTGEWGVWEQLGTCDGGNPDPGEPGEPNPGDFVVSQAQFEQFFPNRNSFYTYDGLVAALSAYPQFATTGSDTVQRQEAAAFLANVSHETGGLVYIVEQNTANYPHYCDTSQSYGCPAGNDMYYGRGPVQLSWNFNYHAAGNELGIDLLNNPNLVQEDPAIAWKTGLWYWVTQSGPGSISGHTAMTTGAGFGESIRSINGAIECDGGNPAQVQSRIDIYQQFASALGVDPGGNLSC